MKLLKLLDEDLLRLPIPPMKENNHYPSYIFLILRKYKELLETYKVSQEIIDVVALFKQDIYDILCWYYGGDHYFAYGQFKETMKRLNIELDDLVTELKDDIFFRARISDSGDEKIKLENMFHIPFELRTKVASQRYSFPGLPCLYLSSTPCLCWLELDCPDALRVAKLKRNNSPVRILDLSKTPKMIKEEYNKKFDEKIINEYLKLWPLIALCSVCVKDVMGTFKPEYIISQMLVEWSIIEIDILENNYFIDGIKYRPVNKALNLKEHKELGYLKEHSNYVFPVRTLGTSGTCPYLSERFILEEVIY